jgi:RES domain
LPNDPPPSDYNGKPNGWSLAPGTRLSRVHEVRYETCTFNPTVTDQHWGGGRFDATEEDRYGYIYAGSSELVAVSEALLRDLATDDHGARLLPTKALEGRRLGWLAPTSPLDLVSLRSGADLAAVAQDTWLTQAPSSDYAFTRRWGHAIRKWAPWAAGLVWRSRLEPDGLAFIFFDDRCPDGAFEEILHGTPVDAADSNLYAGAGHVFLRALLEHYRVAVGP